MVRRSSALAFVAACGLVSTGLAAGQSVDDLVARNLEAKGGLARMKAVQSIKQTSKLTVQGMEATLTIYSKRPNLVRQEVSVGGQLVVNAFDGATPWIINPFTGSSRPIAVSGPQADAIREQSSFDGRLVGYKERGDTLVLAGLEALGDRKVYHLRFTTAARQVTHLYLDAETALEVKETMELDQLKMEQEFSDYRDVEGLKVPFRVRQLTNGVAQSESRVQTVEFNVKVDDAIFRMPRGQ